ncbi:hypothetical protein AgCh_001201 [Apium graveolens]
MNHRKFLDPNHKWRFDKRRFNGEVETGTSAPMLTGRQVAKILVGYENSFGGDTLTRHNLDVMHIERTICDSVLGTLLNIGGKTKDHLTARVAKFDMTNKEKEIFWSVLENAKFPYGFASNISKCVQDRNATRYKSHGAHVIMQYLLQFAVKGSLKPEVAVPLIRLVQQRWMYFIERYLSVLKKYVRNMSKPERSIAEGYLAQECLTFCARFLNDDQNKSVNESPSVNAKKGGYAIGLGKSKYGKDINLGEDTWIVAHRYIIFNYDDKEVEDLIEKHHKLLDSNLENIAKSKWYKIEKTQNDADGHRQCESSIAPQWRIYEDQELNFKEIGGLYVNRRGWTLVTDDQGVTEATHDKSDVSFYIDNTVDKSLPPMKQMQPFVIVRPRSSPFKVVEKNVDKRTIMTFKDINNEKE